MKASFSYRPISPPPNVTKPAIMARTATAAKIHTQRGKIISVGKGDETRLRRRGLKKIHELAQPCSQHGQAFTSKNRRRGLRLLRFLLRRRSGVPRGGGSHRQRHRADGLFAGVRRRRIGADGRGGI